MNLLVSFCLLKKDLNDGHKGDLLCLSWIQDYSMHTVEQPRDCLSHCYWIDSLIWLSQETYSEDTRVMLPHWPGNFFADVEQLFSKTITFKSLSFSVETVAWPNETVLQSKVRGRFFVALDFYFGQVTKAFHYLYCHCCQEMTCSPR